MTHLLTISLISFAICLIYKYHTYKLTFFEKLCKYLTDAFAFTIVAVGIGLVYYGFYNLAMFLVGV